MINEEHIPATAKKDYVLLCATDWKTDLVPCPSRIEGMAFLSQGRGQAKRTSVGQRKVGGSPEEGDSAGGEEAYVSAASVSSWKLTP